MLCTSSDHALYFYEVSLKFFKRFSSNRADTKLPLSNFKGNYSKKVEAGITVFVFCTPSDDASYFYEVS